MVADMVRAGKPGQTVAAVEAPGWMFLEERVHDGPSLDLHVSIAQSEPACVAPIPQAFDFALARDPTLTLHASDGNHSAPAGAFLAALVLYATITGLSPLDLPALPQFPVSAAV
jgi:hypothetical protein